jgi:hypothetical protein
MSCAFLSVPLIGWQGCEFNKIFMLAGLGSLIPSKLASSYQSVELSQGPVKCDQSCLLDILSAWTVELL